MPPAHFPGSWASLFCMSWMVFVIFIPASARLEAPKPCCISYLWGSLGKGGPTPSSPCPDLIGWVSPGPQDL